MVGNTEISIFEVRRSSTTVCYTVDILSKSMSFRNRCLKVESQRLIRELK